MYFVNLNTNYVYYYDRHWERGKKCPPHKYRSEAIHICSQTAYNVYNIYVCTATIIFIIITTTWDLCVYNTDIIREYRVCQYPACAPRPVTFRSRDYFRSKRKTRIRKISKNIFSLKMYQKYGR